MGHRLKYAGIPTWSPLISDRRRLPLFDLVAQSIVSGVAVGCIYGLIGIGFCVIYNASGIVNFAQGAFVMLGGMVASAALKTYGVPLPLAGLLAIVICAGIGIVLERIVIR